MNVLGGLLILALYIPLLPTIHAYRRGPFIWIPVFLLNGLVAEYWYLWFILLIAVQFIPYNQKWVERRAKDKDKASYFFWIDN